MAKLTDAEVLTAWGESPEVISDGLARFAESARTLSSHHPRLIDKYPQQWVGIYGGNVEVAGRTIAAVIKKLDAKGYPKEETIVRFIDRHPKTLIL